MAIITGGNVIGPGVNPGVKARVHYSNGVPTDANLGVTPVLANGALAQDVVTGNTYEKQAGAWVRVDTL